jgi:hypothetical protein
MQTCGGRDQVGYTGILSIQVAYEHGSRYFIDLIVPAFPQAADLQGDQKYHRRAPDRQKLQDTLVISPPMPCGAARSGLKMGFGCPLTSFLLDLGEVVD